MTSTKLTAAVLVTVAGTLWTGSDLTAQGRNDNSIFEEITVTAKKREESIYEVPVAVSAFSGDAIAKQGIKDLTDIGKFVPNLNVTGFSAGHTSSVNPFIRGIGLQDHLITTDPGVAVYVDGVYLGRQVGQNWSLANIERVEVLRGPQGTLYGRNSIGGAINIITKKPRSGEGGHVGVEVGTRGRVNADMFANVDLSDDVSMAISGAFKHRNGVGKFRNLPDAEKDVGELQDIAARVAIEWRVSEDFSLLFAADGNEGDNGLRPYTTLIDELPNGAVYQAGYRNSDVAADPYDNNTGQRSQTAVYNQAYGISLTADYALSDELNARVIVSDRHSDYESGLDDDGFLDDFLSFPETGFADQTSVELQLNGEYGSWDFVTGLYFYDEDGGNDQDPTIFLGGAGDITLSQDLTSRAIYGNVGFQASDRLRLSGGLRYTEDEKDAGVIINSGFINTTASRNWDEFSWELAATYDLNDRMNVYGTIQNGYQSGQFPPRPYCLFGFLDGSPDGVSEPNCFVANDNVTAINYEGGLKGQPFDNLQMSVAVFYTDYSDLPYQVSTTAGAGFDTRNIIVDQTSIGIEWESSWAVSDTFLVHTSLGYIDVDVDDPDAVAPLTPELTFSLSPEFSVDTRGGGEWTFRADYSFRDDMYGEPSSDPGRFTSIDSRSLLNVDVSYQPADRDWVLGFYGRNVTDERYDNARLNVTDYVLVILSNDASEFGARFTRYFD